jgi:hypothetical protein
MPVAKIPDEADAYTLPLGATDVGGNSPKPKFDWQAARRPALHGRFESDYRSI